MTVGDRIKQRRYELGMTQAELAKRCGTTYQGQTPITQTKHNKSPHAELTWGFVAGLI